MTRSRVLLITGNPRLVAPLLKALDEEQIGIEVSVVVSVHPSMRILDRLRDLRRMLRQQSRVNNTSTTLQLFHHIAYRIVTRSRSGKSNAEAIRRLGFGRRVVHVESANDSGSRQELGSHSFEYGLVVGSDVLQHATLQATVFPVFNLHLGDPAFVRGMPGVFWEIHAGQEAILLTLHALVTKLDAGPVVRQLEMPIIWQSSIGKTLDATYTQASVGIRDLLLSVATSGKVPAPEQSMEATRSLGRLRTTPRVSQLLYAAIVCRRRYGNR